MLTRRSVQAHDHGFCQAGHAFSGGRGLAKALPTAPLTGMWAAGKGELGKEKRSWVPLLPVQAGPSYGPYLGCQGLSILG